MRANRINVNMLFVIFCLLFYQLIPESNCKFFGHPKFVALRNILRAQFQKVSVTKKEMQKDIVATLFQKDWNWQDIDSLAKKYLSTKERQKTWELLKKEGIDMEKELARPVAESKSMLAKIKEQIEEDTKGRKKSNIDNQAQKAPKQQNKGDKNESKLEEIGMPPSDMDAVFEQERQFQKAMK